MMKATLASMIQIMLVAIIVFENPSMANIFLGGVRLNITRLICGVLLHMAIIPEVRCSIELMDFVKCFPEQFKGNEVLAFIIGYVKLFGVVLTEFANIIIIVRSQTIGTVVIDFVALFIVSEIDNLMLFTVKGVNFE